LEYGPVFGRTGGGAFGFGVKVVRGGATTGAAAFAAAAAFLASDDASFMTAANFLVDGGISGAYVTPL